MINMLKNSKIIFPCMKNWQKSMLRGKVEGEMVLLSEGSSVKENPEDKPCVPCVRGSAKISRRVTLALYTGYHRPPLARSGPRGGTPAREGYPGLGVLDKRRSVCLLRSCRRTFLLVIKFEIKKNLHWKKCISATFSSINKVFPW